MITRSEMFQPLLRADPSFEPKWLAFCKEWSHEEDPPLYAALAELARHLIAQLEAKTTDRFDAVLDVVERWHLEGDDYVREAATIGLLEDLQNLNLHDRTSPSDFIVWLRPETRRWWDKVEAFWSEGKLITDD